MNSPLSPLKKPNSTTVVDRPSLAELADEELLAMFVQSRDRESIETIVHRHSPMVWCVIRRMVSHAPDAEDAFQATFLVLGSVGS